MSGNNGSSLEYGTAAGVQTPAAFSAQHSPADSAPAGSALAGSIDAAPANPLPANSLLLHVCCGPCAVMPITRLLDEGFAVTAWFMNPNIQPLAEYLRRKNRDRRGQVRLDGGLRLPCGSGGAL